MPYYNGYLKRDPNLENYPFCEGWFGRVAAGAGGLFMTFVRAGALPKCSINIMWVVV